MHCSTFRIKTKLYSKSEKCTFISYCSDSKAYKLYNPITGKVVVSRNVVFNENASWEWSEDRVKQMKMPLDITDDLGAVSGTSTAGTISTS